VFLPAMKAARWGRAHQAVKRNGEPEDQAAAISLMVSDDAAFMSGQTMLVDGGEGHV
jgi:NAD(P)-dependent dehydrogenase (short-subunit alcohol dehydrogenase family)